MKDFILREYNRAKEQHWFDKQDLHVIPCWSSLYYYLINDKVVITHRLFLIFVTKLRITIHLLMHNFMANLLECV